MLDVLISRIPKKFWFNFFTVFEVPLVQVACSLAGSTLYQLEAWIGELNHLVTDLVAVLSSMATLINLGDLISLSLGFFIYKMINVVHPS